MDKLIIDTSVWIDFFQGKLKLKTHEFLSEALRVQVGSLTDVIRHEILVGASNLKHYRELARLLDSLDCFRIQEDELARFDQFAWELKKKGFKGKYADASIAFLCSSRKIPLFTFDQYFSKLESIGILKLVSFR